MMELYGWNITTKTASGSYKELCGNSTVVGNGDISTIFQGYGKGTLNLGICSRYSSSSYRIQVTLNGYPIVSFYENKKSVVSNFFYKPNDKLAIKASIYYTYIIINSLRISCGGMKYT